LKGVDFTYHGRIKERTTIRRLRLSPHGISLHQKDTSPYLTEALPPFPNCRNKIGKIGLIKPVKD